MEYKNVIDKIPIFAKIEPKTKRQLSQVGRVIKVEKGIQLIREREPSSNLYIQLTGKSIVYNLTSNGKRKILFVFGFGNLLNGNVFNTRSSSMYCETIEPSQLLVISSSDFAKLMSQDFQLTRNLIEAQEHKMWRLSHQMKKYNEWCIDGEKIIFKIEKTST